MSLWSGKSFVSVRALGHRGRYPTLELRSPTHLYTATSELAWTAVLQPALDEDWELPEVAPLLPEEIRLFGAVLLSEPDPWNNGFPGLDRGRSAHLTIELGADGLLDPQVFEKLRKQAMRLAYADVGGSPGARQDYSVYDGCSRADAADLLENIDSSDQLLLAGLARLLGASRLISFADELEEGAIALFISMGAALEFIKLHIAWSTGNNDVPFSAVSDYLRSAFPHGSDVAAYFEERHDERIIAIHPANKFGDFWAPPLMVGDIYHLQKTLFGLYRHILLEAVQPDASDADAR